MKPKIMYCLPTIAMKRVFLAFKEDDRVEQVLLVGKGISAGDIPIRCISYTDTGSMRKIIAREKPDIFIQCDSSLDLGVLDKMRIKKGFICHGILPHSPNNISKAKTGLMRYDLLCGGSRLLTDLVNTYAPNNNMRVAINTLTQFDTLYNILNKESKIRNSILSSSRNPSATKIITLFSHRCKHRVSLIPHNYGYYKSAIELAKIAEKNNWLVVIKPKSKEVDRYIANSKEPWVKDIAPLYKNLKRNKYVKFIEHSSDPYKYFCADLIMCSARSTIDVEAAMIRKPYIIIRAPISDLHETNDMYETGIRDFGAAYELNDLNNMEDAIHNLFTNGNILKENQDKFMRHLGIIFDGNAHRRVIDNVLEVLK